MNPQTYKSLEFDRLISALAGLATTDESRERLSAIKPNPDVKYVTAELTRVEEVRRLIQRNGSLPGGASDIRTYLKRSAMSGSILEENELLAILFHLRIHSAARKLINRETNRMPLVTELAVPLEPIPELEGIIDRAISAEGTVRDSASPELGRLRKSIAEQMDRLRARLMTLIPKLAKQGALREESFSIRDGRYVLPVRSDAMGAVKGIVHDRSATGGTLFVEPAALIDLGNDLRAFELAEREEVRRILRELTSSVRAQLGRIETNERVIVALDCLWAKARLAEALDANAPAVTVDGPIIILNGRHPLLALSGRNVVPLNIELGDKYGVLVISGPNAGGKSVALKTVGLLCIMTACGLQIPALPGTEIPLFTSVEADIGDMQSITDDLSTFTAHAVRLREILAHANKRTLILIDEIGAGTDPHEGASLSVATLERLVESRIPTIVTTHHGALKAFAHTADWCANGSMEFDLGTFRPTYRFRPHIPGSSYALDIAKRVGLPDELISRARELVGGDRSKLEELIASLTDKLSRYDTLLQDQTTRTGIVAAQEEDYKRKLERLREREKQVKHQAMQEVEELLKTARKTVEATVKEIREKGAAAASIKNARETLAGLRKNASERLDVPSVEVPQPPSRDVSPVSKPHKDPVVGDYVTVDNGGVPGQVTAVSAKGDRLCVAIGSVQLWVTRQRVDVVEGPEEAEVTVHPYVRLPEVPFELDLRGLDASEALVRVEKYLYDGYNTGRARLGIIHGKGTGILSRHVQRHLKGHSLVESYRFGEYGEGDYGVTIVTLKS